MNQFTRIVLDAIQANYEVRNELAEKYQHNYADYSQIERIEDDTRQPLVQADIDIVNDIYEIVEMPPEANIITDLLSSAISLLDNKGIVNWLRNDLSIITDQYPGKKDAIILDEYNGWINHPTWLVSLWVDNDEYLSRQSRHWYTSDEWQDNINYIINDLALNKYARALIDLYLSFVVWSELVEE